MRFVADTSILGSVLVRRCVTTKRKRIRKREAHESTIRCKRCRRKGVFVQAQTLMQIMSVTKLGSVCTRGNNVGTKKLIMTRLVATCANSDSVDAESL